MRSKVFSQLDPRWSKLPYPNKKYTIGSSGCGCVSVTHVIIETDTYKDYTPKDVQPYMKQFAVPGQGTSWDGITQALKHYGLLPINHPTMPDLFKTLEARKQRMGIIIFRAGTRAGITWTTWGHCQAFTDYKVVKGKHYFYMKDSGGRKHTGWFCYETQMKGLIPQVWSAIEPVKSKKTKTVKKATKKVIKATKKTKKAVTNAQKLADTAKLLAYPKAPDEARYPDGTPKAEYKEALNKVYPNRKSWSKAPSKGASCDVFIGTCVRSSGVDKKFPRGLSDQIKYLEKSKRFDLVKSPTLKKLQDGDIIVYKKNDDGGHICMFVDGKIKHAALKKWYGRTTNNAASMLSTKGRKWVKVYRAK